jgi:hypothetical protein
MREPDVLAALTSKTGSYIYVPNFVSEDQTIFVATVHLERLLIETGTATKSASFARTSYFLCAHYCSIPVDIYFGNITFN